MNIIIIIILVILIFIFFFINKNLKNNKQTFLRFIEPEYSFTVYDSRGKIHKEVIPRLNKLNSFDEYNVEINIGNYLSVYFYELGKSILKKENFSISEKDYTNKWNKYKKNLFIYKNIMFIKYLPKYIPFNNIIYSELIKNNITLEYFLEIKNDTLWFINDNRILYFWNSIKNLAHTILDNAFKKSNLFIEHNNPIIHFRCADTPFRKHKKYHFSKYDFYKNTLQKIYNSENNNINKEIIILSCNDHLSNNNIKISCTKYSDLLVNYLNKNGYNAKVECNALLIDLAKIFYAPAVISIGSSFSFIPGFLGKGIFITSEHIEENNEQKCTVCSEWMFEGKIKHENILDYYNVDEVEKILLSKI